MATPSNLPRDDAEPVYPTSDIAWLLEACEADKPLPPGDSRHHDFTKIRGMDVLTELSGLLSAKTRAGTYHHRVLCGHRGSGKSTELHRLKSLMDRQGFLAVRIEVDLHVGLEDLQFSDLYLLAAMEVARAMETEDVGVSLPPDKLKQVIEWFATVTEQVNDKTKAELNAEAGVKLGSVFSGLVGGFFAKLTAKGHASTERSRTLKHVARPDPRDLIERTNDLLETASALLHATARSRGLLLLFDNLDRFKVEVIDAVLFEGASQVRQMASHAVFTMPIGLYYDPVLSPHDCYGTAVLLPMLALRAVDATWQETVEGSDFTKKSVDEMVAALKRRIDLKALFRKTTDATSLARLSGGCMRELLHLVCLAYQKSLPSDKVTPTGVERAIRTYRSFLTDGLLDDDLRRLAALADHRDGADVIDKDMLRLLKKRIVFRYWNGERSWADVHPLVIETEGFRRARQSASRVLPG